MKPLQLSLPVLIEQTRERGSHDHLYAVRPLWQDEPRRRSKRLNIALARLAGEWRRELEREGKEPRHDRLAALTFAPEIREHREKIDIELRKRRATMTCLCVSLQRFDRRVVRVVNVPGVWFELHRGEPLRTRLRAVLREHFTRLEAGPGVPTPESLSCDDTTWITTIELTIQPRYRLPDKDAGLLSALGEFRIDDGQAALDRVGRRLDTRYPDDLDRVVLRDALVAEAERLLGQIDRRPVLLVGPPKVGKTAIVHELVYRRVARRQSPYSPKENTWLISPQRLISGASYVGQWEQRLLAILDEARRRRLILYVDDLPGLFLAGKTANSDLSVAQVLKPHLERGECRLLGETTPPALRVLQERDRGFADLFHLLHVPEPPEPDTLRILIETQRRIEARTDTRFDLDALPCVIDLQRRHARRSCFPGKAAAFLNQLAVARPGSTISRRDALDAFQRSSGLPLSVLDDRLALTRSDVIDDLSQRIIGQPEALEAAADVLMTAKARLSDPDRPLAAFLFLGPTGVGKTETAKALATFLFGGVDRLVRLDMNEFAAGGAAARLVGTFDSPEGLLTGRVRRQPFSVVLLDEIEKAHPDVFDVLLQVLGEGRLTDAHGRTVDFTDCIIILTSNLGVREAESQIAFAEAPESARGAYIRAAERFFRPEFFNRLDRIVPFGRLSRADIRRIARLEILRVLRRPGLARRRTVLKVTPAAMERIVDGGYHPQLGARALKRSIERSVAHHVAEALAVAAPGRPTAVTLTADAGGNLAAETRVLEEVAPAANTVARADVSDPAAVVEWARRGVADALDQIQAIRPDGPISRETLTAIDQRYFALKEEAEALAARCDAIDDALTRLSRAPAVGDTQVGLRRRPAALDRIGFHVRLENPRSAGAEAEIADFVAARPDSETLTPDEPVLRRLVRDAAMLAGLVSDTLAATGEADAGMSLDVLLVISEWNRDDDWNPDDDDRHRRRPVADLCDVLSSAFALLGSGPIGYTGLLRLRGIQAWRLAALEAGTHLVGRNDGSFVPLRAVAVPIRPGESVADARDRAENDGPLPPVLRTYNWNGKTVDLRTGLECPGTPTPERLAEFIAGAMPVAPDAPDDHEPPADNPSR
jgi:ATP-dependent Clp protease ATP-binding subunit ClpC